MRPESVSATPASMVLVLALLVPLAACNLDSYRLGGSQPTDASTGDRDTGMIDADASPGSDTGVCIPVPEVCGDNIDNDCDGNVDEGFDLERDPANCGACGNVCARANAAGTCEAGTCAYSCLPGFHDLDGDLSNGCEYGPCFVVNNGEELCNYADDDCDGIIDEGIDTTSDVDNCGQCANVCRALNAEPLCVNSACTHGTCEPGFEDVLPNVPGCEYACPQYPPADIESCDGIDNNCNGVVDELPIDGLGDDCTDPGYEIYGDTGECSYGVRECYFGSPTCVGYAGPTPETCDNLDNDCDGTADEDFDKLNDPRYCGDCTPCNIPNAVAGCNQGVCTISFCRYGWEDADGDITNGCEYACTRTGPEVCDGLDNDCDGRIDEDLTPPPNFCLSQGACAGTTPTCSACEGSTQWRCVYGGDAEVDACGRLAIQETLCDSVDNDCDGRVDEHLPLKGQPCDDGGIGVCQGTGAYICDPDAPTQLVCEITSPGQPPSSFELCNGVDDDCDGLVDEDAVDYMVQVAGGSLPTFWIDAYEASRPDATETSGGIAEHRACSVPGVLPWRSASWFDAADACAAAGKRLCAENEWQLACAGLASYRYPYGNTYDPLVCNGRDYDYDCTAPDDHDILMCTGTPFGCPPPPTSLCVSAFGAYDMSGNLKEWTATESPPGSGSYRIRGGAYDNIASGLTCDFSFLSLGASTIFPNVGFRCCADSAP